MFAHKLVPRPSSQCAFARMAKTLSFHTSNDVLSAKKTVAYSSGASPTRKDSFITSATGGVPRQPRPHRPNDLRVEPSRRHLQPRLETESSANVIKLFRTVI
jgi:hypothetical protein